MRRLRPYSCALSIVTGVLIAGLSAQAGGFPGKGDPADWSDALPYYNLANRYLQQARYEDAIEKYQEAIARYQFDADFFINLGVAYRKLDDFTSAQVAFQKALALNEKDWMSWSNLANAYLKQNKLKETIFAFEKALKCNPPASERIAMQKDIGDIKKILSMQGDPVQNPAARAPAKKTGPGQKNLQQQAIKPASGSSIPLPEASREDLKTSGWDYLDTKPAR